MASLKEEDTPNVEVEESEDSDLEDEDQSSLSDVSDNEAKWLTMFKRFSGLLKAAVFTIAYFELSAFFLNWASRKYFKTHDVVFGWNIYKFILKK